MKRNIQIITTALLLVLIPLSVYIALCFICGLGGLTNEVGKFAHYITDDFFEPLEQPGDTLLSLFLLAYSGLMAYLFITVNNLRFTLKSIYRKGVFEDNQAGKLRRAGSGIIIFAKLKYLLLCAFGSLAMWDVIIFFRQLLPYLALYITGKFILVIADMAKRGETLLEETELTI